MTCHHELHQIGVRTFERQWADALSGSTLREWAATYARAYANQGLTHISAIVPGVVAKIMEGGE